MLLLFGLGFVFIVTLALLFSKIHMTIHYTYEQNSHHMEIALFIWRIKCYRKEIDLTEFSKGQMDLAEMDFTSFLEVVKKLYRNLKEGNNLVKQLIAKFRVLHFSWITQGGTGNAVSCGLVSGGLWAIKGMILAFINEKIQLKCKPFIQVEPSFGQRFLYTDFDCMVSIRLGQAIYALIKIIKNNNQTAKAST